MYTRDSLFQSLFSFDMVTLGIWLVCHHKLAVSCTGVCGHGPHHEHAHCWQQDLWGCFCPCQVRKTTHLSFIFRKNRLSIVLSPCLIHPGIGLSKAVCRQRSWKPSKETSFSSKFSSFPRWLSDKCRARKRKCRTVRHDHNAYYTTVFVSYHMEWIKWSYLYASITYFKGSNGNSPPDIPGLDQEPWPHPVSLDACQSLPQPRWSIWSHAILWWGGKYISTIT